MWAVAGSLGPIWRETNGLRDWESSGLGTRAGAELGMATEEELAAEGAEESKVLV